MSLQMAPQTPQKGTSVDPASLLLPATLATDDEEDVWLPGMLALLLLWVDLALNPSRYCSHKEPRLQVKYMGCSGQGSGDT